jgi:hypothetical protein
MFHGMGKQRSPRKLLIDMRLGQPVETWLRERREQGISWNEISYELRDTTQYAVSGTTLNRWLTEDEPNGGAGSSRQSA